MSQGLPVIYSKREGFEKQFEEGVVGYHASSDSLEEIEKAIFKVATNYKLLSKNAVANIIKFDWGKIANNYLTAYSAA
jgi:glycosyltransferase involved in cell wall biosynthesis